MKKFNSLGETFNYYHYLIGSCNEAFEKYKVAADNLDRRKAKFWCNIIKTRVSNLATFLDLPFIMDDSKDSFYSYHCLFLEIKKQYENNLKCFAELQSVFKPYNFFETFK